MKSLNTLIKLHRRNLDELRRNMGVLENQKEQLQLLSKTIHEELQNEIKLAGQQPDMAHFFGDFAKRIQQRQADIAKDIQAIDKKIAKLNEQIVEAFAELKKFEIAKENALKREREAAARRETVMMDEIAAQQHRRKENE